MTLDTEMKLCCCCKQLKSFDSFYKDKKQEDGLYRRCKVCHSNSVNKWQENNKEKHHENCKNWRDSNKEKFRDSVKKWRASNYSRYRENERMWRAKNSYSTYVKNANRTRALKNATPVWADADKIAEIYSYAKKMECLTGESWHVDHVIPLRSSVVCGLHVHSNLQAIPARENLLKRNKFDIS